MKGHIGNLSPGLDMVCLFHTQATAVEHEESALLLVACRCVRSEEDLGPVLPIAHLPGPVHEGCCSETPVGADGAAVWGTNTGLRWEGGWESGVCRHEAMGTAPGTKPLCSFIRSLCCPLPLPEAT